MSEYSKKESRTFIEIVDDLNDLVTELNDKIAESIREKTADVVSIKHGHWYENDQDKLLMRTRCSICNKAIYSENHFAYCPNCGAKMDTRTTNRRSE